MDVFRGIISLLAIVGMLSCTKVVTPPASQQASSQLPSQTKAYKPIENLPYVAWWEQFNDEGLNHLIKLGLAHNSDIHIAIANLQQAQGALQQVKLSWLPNLVTYAGYSTNPALGAPGGFYGIMPFYALNIIQLYSQQKQAQFNVDYYQAALGGMRLMIIGQISASYFTLLAQREQLRLVENYDKDLKTLITLNEKDIQIGLANHIDLAQLKTDERKLAASIPLILHNIVVSENALRFLINAEPGSIDIKHNFSHFEFTRIKPGSLPVQVLNNRPDMRMAESAMKAAEMNIHIAYGNFFPLLQLDEFIGETHLPHSKFGKATDAYFNGKFSLSTLGEINTSKGGYYAKVADFIKTTKRILKEVDTDYSANKRMNEQYLIYLKAENDYRYKYKLQQGLLKTGLISYKELVGSKIYLDDLALATNQAKLELALSLVILYQDLAGGYAADKRVCFK